MVKRIYLPKIKQDSDTNEILDTLKPEQYGRNFQTFPNKFCSNMFVFHLELISTENVLRLNSMHVW